MQVSCAKKETFLQNIKLSNIANGFVILGNRNVKAELNIKLNFIQKGKFSLFASSPFYFNNQHFFGGYLALTGTCSHFWSDCHDDLSTSSAPPPSPTAFWDTSQVQEDCGTIHKTQHGSCMRSGKPAVKPKGCRFPLVMMPAHGKEKE